MVTMADIAESLRSVRSDHVAILSGLLAAGAASMSYHAEDLDYRQDFDARRGHDDDASEYDEPLAQLNENAGKIAELLSAIHGESKPPEQLTIDGDPEPCTWDGQPLYAPETVREGLFQPEAFEQLEGQTALDCEHAKDAGGICTMPGCAMFGEVPMLDCDRRRFDV